MSKRKKFEKIHISRMGYDLSKFYTAPRRKRERTESEAMKSNEKPFQRWSTREAIGGAMISKEPAPVLLKSQTFARIAERIEHEP